MQDSITPQVNIVKAERQKEYQAGLQKIAEKTPKELLPFLKKVEGFIIKLLKQIEECESEVVELARKQSDVFGFIKRELKDFQREENMDLRFWARGKYNKAPSKLRVEELRSSILGVLKTRISFPIQTIEECEKTIQEFLAPETRIVILKLLWSQGQIEKFKATGGSTTVNPPVNWDKRARSSGCINWGREVSQDVCKILKRYEGKFVIRYGGYLIRGIEEDYRLAYLQEVTRNKVKNSDDEWELRGRFFELEYGKSLHFNKDIPKLEIMNPYFGSHRFAVFEPDFYREWLYYNAD